MKPILFFLEQRNQVGEFLLLNNKLEERETS